MVFISNGKTTCFGDVEISTSPRGLGILYKTIYQESCENLMMTAIGRNM